MVRTHNKQYLQKRSDGRNLNINNIAALVTCWLLWLHQTKFYAACLYLSTYGFCLLTTAFVILYWRTGYSSITAKNTTITLQRFKSGITLCANIKILTGICRHRFFFLVLTNRAGNYWLKDDYICQFYLVSIINLISCES